jgi:hypothetical protein
MGMYTELVMSARLKDDPDMIAALKWMLAEGERPETLPNHELFTKGRANWMLTCCSYYFVPRSMHLLEFDDISKDWTFIVRCDLKNYDGEIEAFVDWLTPYFDEEDEMVGYKRYEEDREPTIIYSPERQS